MIYASFTFNLKYVQYNIEEESINIINIVKGWLSLSILTIGAVLYYKKYKNYKMLMLCICLISVGLIATHIGPKYFHYMTLNLPLFSLGIILVFVSLKDHLLSKNNNLIIFTTSLVLLFGYTFYKKNQEQYIKDQDDTLFIQNTMDIVNRIPLEQRPSIFTYNVLAKFWLIIDELPSSKYFVMQEWHGSHDNTILIEINKMILDKQPLWVVIPNQDIIDKSINPTFYTILSEDYEEHYQNDDLILLKRKSLNVDNL